MAIRDVSWAPQDSPTIYKVEISQSYGSDLDRATGCHRGHVVICFHPNINAKEVNNKIQHMPGVARTQLYNGDSAIIVSIDYKNDAFEAMKKISRAMLGSRMITQDEVAGLYRALEVQPIQKNKPNPRQRT